MKVLKILGSFCLSLLILNACSSSKEDLQFTKEELKFLGSYGLHDTICFISSDSLVEMFRVVKRDSNQKKELGFLMASPAYNSIGIDLEGIYQDSGEYIKNNKISIGLTKFPQTKKVGYSILFRDFFYTSENFPAEYRMDTIVINENRITNYYLLSQHFPERVLKPDQIENVIWIDGVGLFAYKYRNGDFYMLFNNK